GPPGRGRPDRPGPDPDAWRDDVHRRHARFVGRARHAATDRRRTPPRMSSHRSTRHRPGRFALVGGIAMALGLAGIAAAWVEAPVAAGSHAEIRIHFSHFGPTEVVAKAGVPITITLVNT